MKAPVSAELCICLDILYLSIIQLVKIVRPEYGKETLMKSWVPKIIILAFATGAVLFALQPESRADDGEKATYVGSAACQECHETEYENFTKYAKKAKSYKSIQIMRKGLTESEIKGCYQCHTTGYGQPGGFQSAAKTPHLQNAGCEVCHGPGSIHIESEDPEDLGGDLSIEGCRVCHNSERVASFNFKPMLYGGAH